MSIVLVTGLPGSGKSTLASALASHLDLPLIAKDRFKEILFDTLGAVATLLHGHGLRGADPL